MKGIRGRNKLADIPYEDRIKSKVEINEKGCWIWKGAYSTSVGKPPRPIMRYKKQTERVARVVLEVFKGISLSVIDQACHIDDCDKRCINPDHLYNGDNSDNMRDRYRLKKEGI